MKKPNIILLTIDTLRADRVGCFGHTGHLTPNLDRLANTGVIFSQAITGGSWTQAAFPTILTSTYASMYGGCLGPLAPERPSPLEALAANGYATAGFSSSPLLSREYGYQRGFEYFRYLDPGESDPKLRSLKGGHRILEQPLLHNFSNLIGKRLRPARLYSSASDVNKKFFRWVDNIQHPFFAWLHYMDVHWPYFIQETLVHPKQVAQAWRDLRHLYEVTKKGKKLTPEKRDYYVQQYERAVYYTDAQLGHLLDNLNDIGLEEDTAVVVVSDHGEEFMERRTWGHVEVNLYDEILKVPLTICLPSHSQSQVIKHQVSTLDIMPTILDLSGIKSPDGLKGSSLVPLWSGDEDGYDAPVAICERWRDTSHMVAVRSEEYKYIWCDDQPDEPNLFDLKADQAERYNIARQHPEVVAELHAYVNRILQLALETEPKKPLEAPELDDDIVTRLRGLGYLD